MPATSAKQKKFMDAAAHNPEFAKKAGIPVKVAKEFSKASKGQKFSQGGHMATKKMFGGKESMKEEMAEAKAIKSGKITPKQYAKGEQSESAMKKGGKVQKYGFGGFAKKMIQNIAPTVKTVAQKIAASPVAQKAAASPTGQNIQNYGGSLGQIAKTAFGRGMAAGGNVTKMGSVKTSKPTRGSASSRADGIAQKGKTKGKMLQKGGKC